MEDLGLLLQLTGIGMGMTFLAIGALVLGMYAMTRIIRDRSEKPAPVTEAEVQEVIESEVISAVPVKARAAVAAVAVALSQSTTKQHAAVAAVAVALAQQKNVTDANVSRDGGWNSTIRSRQVTHRDRFASRRKPNV